VCVGETAPENASCGRNPRNDDVDEPLFIETTPTAPIVMKNIPVFTLRRANQLFAFTTATPYASASRSSAEEKSGVRSSAVVAVVLTIALALVPRALSFRRSLARSRRGLTPSKT
jgi:hypothetical protein